MKNVKHWLMTAAMLLCSFTMSAETVEINGIWYNLISEIKQAMVTYRGDDASSYDNEYSGSVTIPATVTYDGEVYSVTSIGQAAFSSCSSLTSITIPESVTGIGSGAFYGCTNLTSIIIPDGVTEIGYYTFGECSNITSITIPDGVTSIGSHAFYNCSSLTSITIPDGVTGIGYNTFNGCSSLISVAISDKSKLTFVGPEAFNGCSSLARITIPEGVTSIGDDAFYNCNSLTSITIPENSQLSSIGSYAFCLCRSLTSITIPEGVTSIANSSFSSCNSLTSVTLPESVTSIGDDAFAGCSITSITIPEGVTSIGTDAFDACNKLSAVYINSIEAWCRISFSNYLSNPLHGAYRKPKYLYLDGELVTELVIPEGVTSIGNYAFYYYGSLTSITIPASVTSIGNEAFYYCNNLTSVAIPEESKLTLIGESAFYSCEKLRTISFPKTLAMIKKQAFCYCESLEDVTIPENVGFIYQQAFYGCSALKSIKVLATEPPFAYDDTFSDYSIKLWVPAEAVERYKATEPWSSFSTITPLKVVATEVALPIVLTEADALLEEYSVSTNSAGTRQYEYTSPVCSLDEATNTLCFTFLKGKSTTVYSCDNSGYPFVALAEFYLYDGEGNKIALDASNFSTNAQEAMEGPVRNICDGDRTTFWHSEWSGDGVGAYHNLKITLPEGKELSEFQFKYITRYTSQCLPSAVLVDSTDEIGSVSYSGTNDNGLSWTFNDGNLVLEGTGVIEQSETGFGGVKSVEIIEGISSIGESAFYNCSSLTSITFPESVTEIGKWAFRNCSSLTSITLPASMKSIGVAAFQHCINLTSITIPESVTSIGDYAFNGCSSLTSIIIPENVTSIGYYTFYGCSALQSVKMLAAEPPLAYGSSFSSYNTELCVPAKAVDSYKATEPWSNFSTITPFYIVVTEITLNQSSVTLLKGESFTLCATVSPDDADNKTVTWSSSDENVATVDAEGKVTAIALGTATITATANDGSEVTASCEVTVIKPTSVILTINQYGSGTFCSEYALDFSEVEGLRAYAATGYNNITGVVTLTRVKTTQAGEGLFVKGEPGVEYRVPILESSADNTLNLLVGTLEDITLNATSDNGLYANYKYTIKEGDAEPLFYQFSDGSTQVAGKAYLQIPVAWLPATESKAISLRFDDGETTDIEDIELMNNNQQSIVIFDLMGRRVENLVKGEIYIVNGKKFVY